MFRLAAIAALAALAATTAALATSEYTYRPNEYAIIDGGLSPAKQFSVAAHGEGEGGSDKFRLHLMTEPAHRTLEALKGITAQTILDSAPGAFHALWSPDSRHVAVMFRSERHAMALALYEIRHRRAWPVALPALLGAVTKRPLVSLRLRRTSPPPAYDVRTSVIELTWIAPGRFLLKERKLLQVAPADAAALEASLRGFGRKSESAEQRRDAAFVDFSAEAVARLGSNGRFRFVSLKPGRFAERR